MKIVCTQENLKKAISATERVVSKQNTLPILNNILIKADKNKVNFFATNLEIGVQVKLGAKIEEGGQITIPAKLLSSFTNNLPQNNTVSMDVLDQSLKLKSGSVKASIKGLSADEFPLLPQKNTDFLFKIKNTDLRDILSKIIISIAFNDVRQELAGINLVFKEKEIIFASTDSFRLTFCKFDIKDENKNIKSYSDFVSQDRSIIIPGNTILELLRLISSEQEGWVSVFIEESQIFFEFFGIEMVSRLINGKYPDYQHIIPKEYKTTIIGQKTIFQGALKMASVFAFGKSNEIKLKIDTEENKTLIEARSVEVGENSTELNFELQGESQDIVFNAKYLLDGVGIVSTPKIALLFNSESTPVAVCQVDDLGNVLSDCVYIVMPIKN